MYRVLYQYCMKRENKIKLKCFVLYMEIGKPIKSEKINKKLKVLTPNKKIIHFGDSKMQDFTQHKDKNRQTNYCKRASGIKNKKGKLTKNDKESANYYSLRHLWSCDKRKDLNLGLI